VTGGAALACGTRSGGPESTMLLSVVVGARNRGVGIGSSHL